jgi:hypothetical protein
MGLEYKYTEEEMRREFNKIRNTEGDYLKNPLNNKIILTYQPHFYEYENYLYKTDPIIRRKLIENRIKYLNKKEYELTDKELLRGFKISGIHYGFSHFSSFWIKAFIKEFNINSVYDFCGGWGHRLLGAMNIDYIYNDIDKRTYNNCKKIFNDFDFLNKNKIFYNEDCSEFIPKEVYDAVLTCPPYYTTEIYNYKNTSTEKYSDYSNWLDTWWRLSIKNSVKNCKKYFSFVINNVYKEDMKSICIEEGLKFMREVELGSNKNLNHFQRSSNNVKKGEFLLIFYKENVL